ncbi:MAG: Crp/Fnr family transcriptional regulator [Winogradskyella sp.]|uniref:Crp/Fnr family transcriptional regulator n=1 Tax=Winogradskyella sp. TaxID=1883156 RepID=UPI000F3B72E8|nr:Crp/Fnr family transcriptional regulator [Winogradskyella sp.]RNC87264.1 MAG: Crp/Fnr family transcriptional regulator [Winogradskyella sp.]
MSLLFKKHIQEILPKLSDDEFSHITSFFKPLKRKKHQFLVQEGEMVTNEYWVIKGCIKAYYLDQKGKEHILQFATENWWITDFNAYFNQVKATIYIDCIEDSELLSITLDQRNQLCKESHNMEHYWRVKSNYGYAALQQRILSLLWMSAEDRYNQMLKLYPNLFQRVPKKMIAAYLGVSRETLSRL